MSSYVDIDIG